MASRNTVVLGAVAVALLMASGGALAFSVAGLLSHPAEGAGPVGASAAASTVVAGTPPGTLPATSSSPLPGPDLPAAAAHPSTELGPAVSDDRAVPPGATPAARGAILSSEPLATVGPLGRASPAGTSSAPGGSAVDGDYSAVAPSGTTIGTATGSFPGMVGLSSEYTGGSSLDPSGGSACSVLDESNCYSLQINTNEYGFVSTPFTGTSDYQYSWEQFVYYNDPTGSSGVLWIWYVLINSIPAKSGCNYTVPMDGITWGVYSSQPSNCYGHTPGLSVPSSFLSAPLSTLYMVATADYLGSGNDTLQLCSNAGLGCSAPVVAPDDVIDVAPYWTYAEFNVFGDGGGSEANFTVPGTLNVSTAITDPNGNPLTPSCTSYSETGETNNLFLGPCQTSGSAITFTESSMTFSLSATPSDLTVLRGGTASYSVGVTLVGGAAAPVTLSVVSGTPSGATASFSSGSVTPSGTSTLEIATAPGGGLGDYTVTFQGQYDGLLITNTTRLHVYDFGVELSPPSQTIVRGLTAVYALNLTLDPGSTTIGVPAAVLSDPGLPAGATGSFSSGSVVPTLAGCSSSTPSDCIIFGVQTQGPPSGALGDFTPSVTATVPGAGGGARSASVALHLFDFSVSLSPSALTLVQGGSSGMTVSVGLVAGSSTVGLPGVALALAGVPAGISVSGFPSTVGIPSTSSFSLGTAGSGGFVSCPQVLSVWGQNLRGADLAHCMLAGASLRGDDLQGANLTAADLENANLEWANLRGADLAGANTAGANFFGANLAWADLSGVGALGTFTLTVTGTTEGVARLGSASLTVLGDQLSGDDLQQTNLWGADLVADQLVGSYLQLSDLQGVNATGSNFSGAYLQWSILAGINAPGSNFSAANLTGDDLAGADLAGAYAAYADLSWANLPFADLAGAYLAHADLRGANLPFADLAGAYLAHADLRGANLPFADLKAANLEYADLQRADLHDANLEDANLTGANLSGANLTGANLTGATLKHANLKRADLKGAQRSGSHVSVDLRGPTSSAAPAAPSRSLPAGWIAGLLQATGGGGAGAVLGTLLGAVLAALVLSSAPRGGHRSRGPREGRSG